MKKIERTLSFVLLFLIGGCSTSLSYDKSRLCISDDGIYTRCDKNGQAVGNGTAKNIYSSSSDQTVQVNDSANLANNNKLLADYVEQLSMTLIDTLSGDKLPESVAVTPFFTFGDSTSHGNWLAEQITEAFYHELQLFGLAVTDIDAFDPKSTDYLNLKYDLMDYGEFTHILIGSISLSKKGVVINSRIVNIENQTAIATAKGFIPKFVLASVHNTP